MIILSEIIIFYFPRKDKEKRRDDELREVEQKNYDLKEQHEKYVKLINKLKLSFTKNNIPLPEFNNAM